VRDYNSTVRFSCCAILYLEFTTSVIDVKVNKDAHLSKTWLTQSHHNPGPSRPGRFNTHETLDVIYSDLDLEVDLDDVYPDSNLESLGVGDESILDLDNPDVTLIPLFSGNAEISGFKRSAEIFNS